MSPQPEMRESSVELRIVGTNIDLTEVLHSHVERRLHFALSRFGDRIGRVTVRLVSVNGPDGRDDTICLIDLKLRPAGRILVRDANRDRHAAIDCAADRAGRAVSREFELDRAFDGHAAKPLRNRTR